MGSYYWIKLYHEILDDHKVGQLPDNLWRRFIELCLMAGELQQDGRLPSVDAIAWRLRSNETTITSEMDALARVGLLDYITVAPLNSYWIVVNFAKRQAKVPAAERMARKRDRDKKLEYYEPVTQPVTGRNTDKDIDKDIDTDNIYIHPDPEPITAIKTALSQVTSESLIMQPDKYDKAAYALLGWDAAPDKIRGFSDWWSSNGYYEGKPALKSIVGSWQDYTNGVIIKKNGSVPVEEERTGGVY